jgi:hypothetical protein
LAENKQRQDNGAKWNTALARSKAARRESGMAHDFFPVERQIKDKNCKKSRTLCARIAHNQLNFAPNWGLDNKKQNKNTLPHEYIYHYLTTNEKYKIMYLNDKKWKIISLSI